MKIEELFTRKKSNEGVEIPVIFPGQEESVGTITIFGQDSNCYKEQLRLLQVDHGRILTLPKEQHKDALYDADLEVVSNMIKSWSFETPFTKENVRKLLIESPFIFELVNKSVVNRSLFMG